MAEKILGPTGSKRRSNFRFLPLALIAVVAIALFLAGGALAVHDQAFQLDGNTFTSDVTHIGGTPPGSNTQNQDWESFINANGTLKSPLPAGFTDSAFVRDFTANPGCNLTATGSFCTQDASTYATGSKDTLPITPGWQCTYSNNVNSKTDLSNVYSTAYTTPVLADGKKHQIIYFGLERNDNSGDGNIAFWFLQDNVGCTATVSGNNVPFTGQHKDGDILVVSSFTNGGTVSGVNAYRWTIDAAHPAPGYLNPTPVANGGDCGSSTLGTGDTTCAIVNKPTITVPWLTANKNDGTGHSLRESEFFEGGLDLTNSGLADKCFSSFLGDTRSSQSLTATIFDFAGGSFEHCGANIQIAPSGVNEVNTPHTFTITVNSTNAGVTSPAPDGTKPVVTLKDQNNNTVTATSDTCASPGTVNGTCTVTVNSTTAKVITAHATASVTIQGTTFNVATDGQGNNSGDAVKRYVDANVSITPSGVNAVGNAHTFTVTSTASPSGTTASLTSLTPSVSPSTPILNSTCASPTMSNGGNTATCTFQINSSSAGVFTANATAVWGFSGSGTPSSATVSRSTSGNSGPGGSGPATKRFVDANVSIAPSGVNEVGNAHTFTVTSTASPSGTTASLTSLTPSIVGNATPILNSTCGSPTLSNGGNTATCTFQINSTSAGSFTANATAVWGFSGSGTPSSATVTRSTSGNSGPGGSGPATKRFVDANVSIASNGVNEVGNAHTFTVTSVASPAGTTATIQSITPSIVGNATPILNSTCGSPQQNGNTATCTFQINSSSAGSFTANATAVWLFSGSGTPSSATVTRSTSGNSGPGGSSGATKRFVDANINITPNSAVNEVNHSHTFTITSVASPSGTTATIQSITPSISPMPASYDPSDCATPHQSGNTATCVVVINSPSPGVFTLNATAVWNFHDNDPNANPANATVTRSSSGNSGPGGGGPATKRFVDAFITIGPTPATNSVGEHHTWVVTVMQDDGLPAGDPNGDAYTGFGPAPDHTLVTVTRQDQNGANSTLILDVCGTNGTTGGTCTYTFTSATAGDVIGNASVTFMVGGVSLTRATGDGLSSDSGPAIKHFVAGSVSWTKVDNAGAPLGGATFQLCRTHDWDIANNMPFAAALNPPVCQSVTDNDSSDTDPTNGHFTVGGLPLGTYTVHETAAPPGYDLDPSTKTINVSPANPQAVIGDAFVDNRPILKITGFGYTNAPAGPTQFNGIFVGTTTYTVNLHNYGSSTAHLTNSSLVVSSNASCTPASPQDLSGIDIAAGADGPSITMTCSYDHPNPKAITATLTVNYTTNGFEYHASGSPATITYTVDPNNP